ncbi:hypothetical protein FWF74_03400 [Candidatus Saccharibacteria bacterium]|nr:hypothetical protein [Candidatus Saccharibacteria bacterium]MCL1962895.1 hypothetical protein [Candidatus Saccharibacteria bacterium]
MSKHESKNWISIPDIQKKTKEAFGDDFNPNNLTPSEFIGTRRFYKENPLSITDFRFPTNPNTGAPMIDLDRIQVSQGRVAIANLFGHFVGQNVTEFNGGGSSYDDEISGRNVGGIMAATGAKRARKEPPEPPCTGLIAAPSGMCGEITKFMLRAGITRPVGNNKLNRTAIHEHIDELKENPKRKKEMTDEEAWAIAMDENLRQSIKRNSVNLNLSGNPITSVVETAPFVYGAMAHKVITPALFYGGAYVGDLIHAFRQSQRLMKMAGRIDEEAVFAGVLAGVVTNIADEYGDEEIDEETAEIIEKAREISTAEHYSALKYYHEITAPREWHMSAFAPLSLHPDSHLALSAIVNSGKLIRYRK